MNDQLKRVSNSIAQVVTEFVNKRIGQEFHGSEVKSACNLALGFTGIAPSSPDRVMRDLRQRGKINYELVNRAKSLYRALPLVVESQSKDGIGEY